MPFHFGRFLSAAVLLWALVVAVHFVREAVWIWQHHMLEPLPCRHWWCPQTWILALSRRDPWN